MVPSILSSVLSAKGLVVYLVFDYKSSRVVDYSIVSVGLLFIVVSVLTFLPFDY